MSTPTPEQEPPVPDPAETPRPADPVQAPEAPQSAEAPQELEVPQASEAPQAAEPQQAAEPPDRTLATVVRNVFTAQNSALVTVLAILLSLVVGAVLIVVSNTTTMDMGGYFFQDPSDFLNSAWQAAKLDFTSSKAIEVSSYASQSAPHLQSTVRCKKVTSEDVR